MNSYIRVLPAASFFTFLALSTPALSQEAGWYGGLGLGRSDFKGSCEGVSGPGISCSETDTAVKIFGGYKFNKNFAFEGGYTDLGKTTASGPVLSSASIKASGVEFTGVGMLPLNPQVSLFARLGFFNWKLDVEGGTGSSRTSGTNPTFGFGVQADVTRYTAVRGEWQRYEKVGDPNSSAGQGKIDFIGVSLVIKF